MTADRNALVEKMARAMWEAVGVEDLWADDIRAYEEQASAALDVALEEVARVVQRQPSPSSEWIADAIRALIITDAK